MLVDDELVRALYTENGQLWNQKGWLDYEACLLESLLSLKRAGADIIFSYGALDAARLLG